MFSEKTWAKRWGWSKSKVRRFLDLLEKAKDQIIIMPGGGTKSEHVPILKESGYLKEIHASCKIAKPSVNEFVNDGLTFSSMPLDFSLQFGVDPGVVNEFKSVL